MKIYILGYRSKFNDDINEILCAHKNRDDASKKILTLQSEAIEINDKINNCDEEESQELWNKYTDKYGIDPNSIQFYFTETELV